MLLRQKTVMNVSNVTGDLGVIHKERRAKRDEQGFCKSVAVVFQISFHAFQKISECFERLHRQLRGVFRGVSNHFITF